MKVIFGRQVIIICTDKVERENLESSEIIMLRYLQLKITLFLIFGVFLNRAHSFQSPLVLSDLPEKSGSTTKANVVISIGNRSYGASWQYWLRNSSYKNLKPTNLQGLSLLALKEQSLFDRQEKPWFHLDFRRNYNGKIEDISNTFRVAQENIMIRTHSGDMRTSFSHYGLFRGVHHLLIEPNLPDLIEDKEWLFAKSFEIHLFIRPLFGEKIMDILTSETQGEQLNGMAIRLEKKRLVISIKSLDDTGNTVEDLITSSANLDIKKWNQIRIVYNHIRGEITLQINGQNEYKRTRSVYQFPEVMLKSFRIGANLYADLDEIYWKNFHEPIEISNRTKWQPYPQTIYSSTERQIKQYYGEWTGPILDLEKYHLELKKIQLSSFNYNGKENVLQTAQNMARYTRIFYRFSNRLFHSDKVDLPWKEYKLSGKIDGNGRFLQWKIIQYPHESKHLYPMAHKIIFVIENKPLPIAPNQLRIVQIQGKNFLHWAKNPDFHSAQYHIFWGLSKDVMTGRIEQIDRKPINYDNFGKGNSILVPIDSEKFYRHQNSLNPGIDSEYINPPLKNYVTYYFKIYALHKEISNTYPNLPHYSRPSETIQVRFIDLPNRSVGLD